MNDVPKIEMADSAVKDRVYLVSYRKSFVEEVKDPERQLLAVPKIKELFDDERWQRALDTMLYREYQVFLKNGYRELSTEERDSWLQEDDKLKMGLENSYEYTGNSDDTVLAREMVDTLKADKEV